MADPAAADREPEDDDDAGGGVSDGKAGALYTTAFWLVFAGNAGLLVANTLDCRFAMLVADRGGSDSTAGLLVGIGVLAVLLSRGVLGTQLDKRGVRPVWATCGVLYALGCVALPFCPEPWSIGAARAVLTLGFGGALTCAVTAAQELAPEDRRTEAMTVLGIGGALGIMAGAAAGDWVDTLGAGKYYWLYGGAAVLGLAGVGAALYGTGGLGVRDDDEDETPGLVALARRYWPGAPLLAIAVKGVVLAVTTLHLARFADRAGLTGLAWFFFAVAGSGALVRWLGKDWGTRFGRHRMVLAGLGCCAAMLASFPFCTADWHLLVPGILGGVGQSVLAPAAVSLGAGRFPERFRGAGTSVMHGAVDGALVISAPALAWVATFGTAPEPGEPAGWWTGDGVMFYSAAGVAAAAGAFYLLTVGRAADEDEEETRDRLKTTTRARRHRRRARRRRLAGLRGRVRLPNAGAVPVPSWLSRSRAARG